VTKKLELMAELHAVSCSLHGSVCNSNSTIVWGEGDLDAPLMIVGEAPGSVENATGRPFVGPAGALLDRELWLAEIPRERAYLTNVVKCRPTRAGGNANRVPTSAETNAWLDVLIREMDIVSPRLVLCLGTTAASAVIHSGFRMSIEHGIWSPGPLKTRAIATYHPAYIRRWKAARNTRTLRQFREDLWVVGQELASLYVPWLDRSVM
jgi:uracil-DNA glycosylase family 4